MCEPSVHLDSGEPGWEVQIASQEGEGAESSRSLLVDNSGYSVSKSLSQETWTWSPQRFGGEPLPAAGVPTGFSIGLSLVLEGGQLYRWLEILSPGREGP